MGIFRAMNSCLALVDQQLRLLKKKLGDIYLQQIRMAQPLVLFEGGLTLTRTKEIQLLFVKLKS